MILTLIRHGHASSATELFDDDERVLSPRGRQQVRELGTLLRGIEGLAPQAVICSPLVRAVQTAEILACGLTDSVEIIADRCLEPGGALGVLLDRLASGPVAGLDSVLLVSHEPTMGRLSSLLCGQPYGPFDTAEARVLRVPKLEPAAAKLIARRRPIT